MSLMSLRRAGGGVEVAIPMTGNAAADLSGLTRWLFVGRCHFSLESLTQSVRP